MAFGISRRSERRGRSGAKIVTMKIVFGGVRGTNPVAQPDFMKYGGETSSFLIAGRAGEQVLIDAGTGVRQLGHLLQASSAPKRVLMLMTHYHLDHVVGLPSLGLIYSPAWQLEIAAPAHDDVEVEATMSRVMDKPFWPLQVEDLKSRLRFTALERTSDTPLRYGGLEIRWCPLRHPGGCTAYRVDETASGGSFVIATDVEWGIASESERMALLSLCASPSPAKLLLMDGQYTPDEVERFKGWGHSTWKEAVTLAEAAGVSRLLLTHHDPRRTDADMDLLRADVQRSASFADMAVERTVLEW